MSLPRWGSVALAVIAFAQGGAAQTVTPPVTTNASANNASAANAPFEGAVRFDAWLERLLAVIDNAQAPAVEREFALLAASRGLDVNDAALRRDFRRVRLLFEAARDGGFWHFRWAITNRNPTSRHIWEQLLQNEVATNFGVASATAECDELSAFVGMLARHAGVFNVGLFYPTWNHTIAVWAPLAGKTHSVLVQLPTSQIFLGCDAGFDRTSFPTKRTNIQAYPAYDLRAHSLLPAARANWMIEQVQRHVEGSSELWSLLRAHRAFVMGSSMGACNQTRAGWARALEGALSPADDQILREVGERELEIPGATARRVLAWLALQYPEAKTVD